MIDRRYIYIYKYNVVFTSRTRNNSLNLSHGFGQQTVSTKDATVKLTQLISRSSRFESNAYTSCRSKISHPSEGSVRRRYRILKVTDLKVNAFFFGVTTNFDGNEKNLNDNEYHLCLNFDLYSWEVNLNVSTTTGSRALQNA